MSLNQFVQSFAIPTQKATKVLKLKVTGGKKKVAISSNWLPLFDFEKGARVQEYSLGAGKGFEVRRVYDILEGGIPTKKVYFRQYKRRRNNPIETLVECASQKLINESLGDAQFFHVTFTKGVLRVVPVNSFMQQVLANVTPESRDQVFAACTSGVDLSVMESEGLSIHSVIEYRPNEKHNGNQDLTETGALSVLRNLKNGIRNLFNEDIMSVDIGQIAEAIENHPAMIFSASLQCDEFSLVKGKKLKEASDIETTSTLDMSLDCYRLVEKIKPPIVLLEQVPGFYSHPAYQMLSLRFRRWGYKEHLQIEDARDHGGLTSRKRGFAVFTMLDSEFSFDEATPRRSTPIWDEYIAPELANCREVTHSKSLQRGKSNGRLRVINRESLHSPTFLKSQPRVCADSVVIEDNDRLYWPTEKLMKQLMEIPDDFHLDCVSAEIGAEIVGQSISCEPYRRVINAINRHIDAHFIAMGKTA